MSATHPVVRPLEEEADLPAPREGLRRIGGYGQEVIGVEDDEIGFFSEGREGEPVEGSKAAAGERGEPSRRGAC